MVMPMILTHFGDVIAERIRAEHRALATQWFERLLDLLPVDAREIFPPTLRFWTKLVNSGRSVTPNARRCTKCSANTRF